MILKIRWAALAAVFMAAFAAHGAELTEFQSGDPVRAAEMNGNFLHLQDQIGVNTAAIAAQVEAIETIELTPGPQGPQGEPGGGVEDFLCSDWGSVQGFENGMPICSREVDNCGANLEQGGWLQQCDFTGATLEDINVWRSYSNYSRFNNAVVTSTMMVRSQTDGLPNAINSSTRFAQNAFGLGAYIAADFRNAQLSDVNFYYSKLAIADFSGAIVSDSGTLRGDGVVIRSNFHGAELSVTDFSNSSLDSAFFFRSEGIGPKFVDASMQGTSVLESNFYGADFSGANMTGAAAYGTRTLWTNYVGANLTQAAFGGADLMGANFSDATFNGTGMWLANLGLTHMRNVTEASGDSNSDLTQSNLFRVVIQGSDLSGNHFTFTRMHAASIINSQFVESSFGGADMRMINRWPARSGDQFDGTQDTGNFARAWMESADMRNALLANSVFDNAYLVFADLRGADFRDSSFLGASLAHAHLSGVIFNGSVMDGANLDHTQGTVQAVGVSCIDCSGRGVVFIDANFTDSDLTGANFRHAVLKAGSYTNVNFTNADLGGVDGLDLADITGVTWSNTICPDYTNSDDNGGTCEGHRLR